MVAASFEWDARKATANLRRHGVSFDDARTVFRDPLAKVFSDPDHSDDEERAIIFGRAEDGRLLLVSFVDRGVTFD